MKPAEAGARQTGVWIAVVALACLHFLLRPVLTEWWAAPDLLAASLLVGTLHLRAAEASVLGFVLGALEGWMALSGAAPLAVVFAVAGFVGVRAWYLFFADVRFFLPLYLFVSAWILTAATAWLTSTATGAGFLLFRAGASALLTAAVCLPLERVVPSVHR